jgi:hypothetical protein
MPSGKDLTAMKHLAPADADADAREDAPSEVPATAKRLGRRAQALLVLGGYLLLSFVLFGVHVLPHPTRTFIGLGDPTLGRGFADPSVYMWALVWWPHAIVHGMDPLVTHVVWAPEGFNLTRTTPIPGAAILGWPVTALAGPVVAYNALMTVAPAFAAWTAFILCRHLTNALWPSVVGGLVFGFSSYELAQMTAHLNLSTTFILPMAVWVVLLRLEGRVRPWPFVAAMAGLLVLQFSFSTELLVTMVFVGGIALVLAAVLVPGMREALARTAGWLGVASGLAAVVVSPYLYRLATGGGIALPAHWPTSYSTDLANLVVPTRVALVAPASASRIADGFVAGLPEEGAFLAPFLVVALLFAVGRGRPGGAGRAVLLGVFVLAVTLSLGPVLHVHGDASVWMPWSLALHVPVIRHALPARLIVYAWLALAVITAMWLARPSSRRWEAPARWGVAGLCLLSLVPNVGQPLWRHRVNVPPFFADGMYRQYLPTDRPTLVIPFGSNGYSMLWQAETDMAFPMAGGYIACEIPPSYARFGIVATFISKHRIPLSALQLKAFLGHMDVGAIVLDPAAPGPWGRVFRVLPVAPLDVGGIRLYRLSESLLTEYRSLNPYNTEQRGLDRSCQ